MRYSFLLLLFLAGLCLPAASQTESILRLQVTDQNGAAVRDAQVSVEVPGARKRSGNTKASGEVQLGGLQPGDARLTVSAKGFEAQVINDVPLKAGMNRREVKLQIANVRDEVQVTQDKREANTDLRGDAFSSVLTSEQLALLPDDPDELEEVLKNMAGPGARIRVNGFTGGRLPPKDQIREIRFRTNQFAAENHDPGFAMVDIFTKPGVNLWHGGVNFGFRDALLNGRNPAAAVRGPGQDRRYAFNLSGPLWKKHTSLFISGDGMNSFDTKTILAALPTGLFNDLVERPVNRLNLSVRGEHGYGKTHALRLEYQRTTNLQENLGVGNFDLADRAYNSDSHEHLVRFSETGTFGKKIFNELRFQLTAREIALTSQSNATTVRVLDAFTSGGAQINSDRLSKESELTDNIDLQFFKRHLLRAGFTLETGHYNSAEVINTNGTFTFANLADYIAAKPLQYSRRTGNPLVDFAQYQTGFYIQDDWRLTKNLTVNYGARFEAQTNLPDKNNFAPRFGIAWSPFRNGKTTFRGGMGVFYDWFGNSTLEQILRVNGSQQTDLIVRNPGYPDPLSGGSASSLPPSVIQSAPDLKMPYVIRSTVGIERELPGNIRLMFNYSRSRGVHELRGINANQPVPDLGRPFPTQGNITRVASISNSVSDVFMVNAGWNNFQKGLFVNGNYRYGRTLNGGDSPFSLPVDSLRLRDEWGPAASDIRHMVFGMAAFPIYKLLRSGVTFNYLSAPPYTITTGQDNNGDAVINDRPAGVKRNSARGGSQVSLGAKLSWSFGWANKKDTGGGMQMTVIRREAGSDMLGAIPGGGASLASKRFTSEVYLQASNILNHANLANFVGVQSSPFFGQATAALPARRIETGIRFNF